VRKSLESALQNKEINLTDLLKQYEEGRERSEKTKADQDEKLKLISGKHLEAEATVTALTNAAEKAKRVNDSLSRENLSLREQNKQIREDCKNIERRYIALENEHSAFTHRNDRDSNSLKGTLEKLKEEKAAAEKQIEGLQERCDSLGEAVKDYGEKEGQWKIKQRHSEERIEKEVTKYK
jgi:chromosome segregation ATPase